jgi:hypothetical protein
MNYLKRISKISVHNDAVASIMNKNNKQDKQSSNKKKEEETVFTEDDFKMFEKTYFNK